MRSGAFSTVEIADVQRFALDELIAHQLTYHSNRATEMQRASDRLGQWGEWLFILLVVMVALKITAVGLHNTHAVTILSTAAALLPAWSAAFVGLRAYSELSLLADQSRRIVAALTLAKRRVQNIVVDSPLASERLGLELSSVTTIMLQDIEGWVQLLSGKTLEPG
jgi:hypothetical protein